MTLFSLGKFFRSRKKFSCVVTLKQANIIPIHQRTGFIGERKKSECFPKELVLIRSKTSSRHFIAKGEIFLISLLAIKCVQKTVKLSFKSIFGAIKFVICRPCFFASRWHFTDNVAGTSTNFERYTLFKTNWFLTTSHR